MQRCANLISCFSHDFDQQLYWNAFLHSCTSIFNASFCTPAINYQGLRWNSFIKKIVFTFFHHEQKTHQQCSVDQNKMVTFVCYSSTGSRQKVTSLERSPLCVSSFSDLWILAWGRVWQIAPPDGGALQWASLCQGPLAGRTWSWLSFLMGGKKKCVKKCQKEMLRYSTICQQVGLLVFFSSRWSKKKFRNWVQKVNPMIHDTEWGALIVFLGFFALKLDFSFSFTKHKVSCPIHYHSKTVSPVFCFTLRAIRIPSSMKSTTFSKSPSLNCREVRAGTPLAKNIKIVSKVKKNKQKQQQKITQYALE